MNQMMPVPAGTPKLFDYSALPQDFAREVSATADRIRRNYDKHVEAGIAMGQDLISVKERLDHGAFTPWVEAEFGWSIRTAQNYMQVAERIGPKAKCVSYLPLGTVYKLASPSTPELVLEEVITRAEAGDPPLRREVEYLISEAKGAAAKAEAEAKITPEERKKQLQAKRREELRVQKWRAEQDADRAKQKQHDERVVAFLKEKLQPDDINAFMTLAKRANWHHVECVLTGLRMPWER